MGLGLSSDVHGGLAAAAVGRLLLPLGLMLVGVLARAWWAGQVAGSKGVAVLKVFLALEAGLAAGTRPVAGLGHEGLAQDGKALELVVRVKV